jgi:hypothetical protein
MEALAARIDQSCRWVFPLVFVIMTYVSLF